MCCPTWAALEENKYMHSTTLKTTVLQLLKVTRMKTTWTSAATTKAQTKCFKLMALKRTIILLRETPKSLFVMEWLPSECKSTSVLSITLVESLTIAKVNVPVPRMEDLIMLSLWLVLGETLMLLKEPAETIGY